MIRCTDELPLGRTRVSLDCDDDDLPVILRAILDRSAGSCMVEGLEINPLIRPAWNIRFVQGPIPKGTLPPLETMKRMGILFQENVQK
jgi:hypothetical protein